MRRGWRAESGTYDSVDIEMSDNRFLRAQRIQWSEGEKNQCARIGVAYMELEFGKCDKNSNFFVPLGSQGSQTARRYGFLP